MGPDTLHAIFDAVYAIGLAIWVGGTTTYALVVRPTLLREPADRPIYRTLRSRYALVGASAGAVTLPAFLAVPLLYPEYRGPLVGIQAIAIIVGILTWIAIVNEPSNGRAAAPNAKWTDWVVLVLGLGLLTAFATRPAPKTTGIVEPSPEVRAQQAIELSEEIQRRAKRRADDWIRSQRQPPLETDPIRPEEPVRRNGERPPVR